MRLDLTGRNVDITPALRQLLTRKLARLERLLQDSAVSAQVVLRRERYRHITDITLHARGDNILTGMGTAADWNDSVAEALEKITQQAQRVKEKWTARKRRPRTTRVAAEAPEPVPVQPPPPLATPVRYAVRRHTLKAAVTRLEAAAEPFVLYRDGDTMRLSLVFRMRSGAVGVIEPEA